jgi:hypothetical protein
MIMRKIRLNIFFVTLLMILTTSACVEDLLDVDIRDQLTGSWSVSEDNNIKSVDYYTVTISKSTIDTSIIRIKNFYAISGTVEAIISDFNLTIPEQTVAGFTFHGYGEISPNMKKIDWSYTVDHNNGFIDSVTATYTKN